MIGAGILDGDVVVVRRQDAGRRRRHRRGAPARARPRTRRPSSGSAHDGARVMLVPENPALEPFEMTDGRILGKVVAVLRKL